MIITIRDGLVVETGTHKELMDKNGFYKSLVMTQLSDHEELKGSVPIISKPPLSCFGYTNMLMGKFIKSFFNLKLGLFNITPLNETLMYYIFFEFFYLVNLVFRYQRIIFCFIFIF